MTPVQDLAALAQQLRRELLDLVCRLGGGHLGGSFSAAEILTVLYHAVLRGRPGEPDRDRFLLSKGHAALAFYLVLRDTGRLPPEELDRLFTPGGTLAAHPELHPDWGIECSSGSLGHGLALGCGLAYALRTTQPPARVFVLLGDGECQEGAVAEAAAFAARHALDRLVAIVDANRLQALQPVAEVASLTPAALFAAAGWDTQIIDGHDCAAVHAACAAPGTGRPRALIAATVKGRGVSYMEDAPLWHFRCPDAHERAIADRELAQP